jgi:hypothetical protein
VPESDRTAVDVDPLRVDAELLRGDDAHRRERLVDLDEVEVGRGEPVLLERLEDGVGRLLVQRGVGAGDDAVSPDLGEPREPELLGPRA